MIANIPVIADNLDYFLQGRVAEGQPDGILLTLLMTIGAVLLAPPDGTVLARYAWRFPGAVRNELFIWAGFIRGIPPTFVIFWTWYLLPVLAGSDLSGTVTVTLVLAWFTAASVMHLAYTGISALPGGQYEAVIVQGFRPGQALWLILPPQVPHNVLPSLTGVFIGLLKNTSLAFIVNAPELTMVAGQVNSRVQICPIAISILTGLVYYLLCFSLEKITQC